MKKVHRDNIVAYSIQAAALAQKNKDALLRAEQREAEELAQREADAAAYRSDAQILFEQAREVEVRRQMENRRAR